MNTSPMVLKVLGILGAFTLPGGAQTPADLNEGTRIEKITGGPGFEFSWWGRSDRTYFIQGSADLMSWQNLEVEYGNNEIIEYGFLGTGERFFLRLRHLPGATGDADGDGLSDVNEIGEGTDPFLLDSDLDGWDDGFEHAVGTNPTLASSKPELAREENHSLSESGGADELVTLLIQSKIVSNTWIQYHTTPPHVWSFMHWWHPDGPGGSLQYDVYEPRWEAQLDSMQYPIGTDWDTQQWGSLGNSEPAHASAQHSFTTSSEASGGQVSVAHTRAILGLEDPNPLTFPIWSTTRKYLHVRTVTQLDGSSSENINMGVKAFTIPPGQRYSTPVELSPMPTVGALTHEMLSPLLFDTLITDEGGLDKTVNPPWLMLPQSQTRFVWATTGAYPQCPFFFQVRGAAVGPPMSSLIGDELGGPLLSFTSNGADTDTSDLVVGVGTSFSVNDPVLRFSVKPYKLLRVTLHPITLLSAAGAVLAAPQDVPTKEDLEAYLDSIFGTQANIFTSVTISPGAAVNWDVGLGLQMDESGEGNGALDIAGTVDHDSEEERNISALAYSSTAHVNVYWIASPNTTAAMWVRSRQIDPTDSSRLRWSSYSPVLGFAGKAKAQQQGTVYVWEYPYDDPNDPTRSKPNNRMCAIAHEIVHWLGDLGHSSGIVFHNFQNRQNSDNDLRLMSGRGGLKRYNSPTLLIKEEWDKLHEFFPLF